MTQSVPDTRSWSSATSTECPVALAEQAWIETSMSWFADQFGADVALRDIVLPTTEFFPASYTGAPEQIAELVARISDLMLCDALELTLDLFDGGSAGKPAGRHAVGHFQVKDGRTVIGLDLRESSDPAFLTAIIAHELSHARLLGEGRITDARRDHERLTDLLTIYLGFGVFTTNAALSFAETTRGWSVQPRGELNEWTLNGARNDGYAHLGYLTEREFGYALACHCRLRGETEPPWAAYLDPGPRAYLQQGLAYLAHTGPGNFPTLRSRPDHVSIRVVPRGKTPTVDLFIPALRSTPSVPSSNVGPVTHPTS
jgi:hypothetical protein